MSSTRSNIDVLVVSLLSSVLLFSRLLLTVCSQVGAGPVGLVAALVLAQNGVSIRIVDKSANFDHVGQRGAGLQVTPSPSLIPRIFTHRLFYTAALARGIQVPRSTRRLRQEGHLPEPEYPLV